MLRFPNAKINLGLHVTAKRGDGYHDIETAFYPIQIKDAVEIHDHDVNSFSSAGIEIPEDGNDNLCLRALKLVAADHHFAPQKITLFKNIPIGAGLGGGSADAAAVIELVNSKFELGLSERARLAYAAQIGADCAFFIKNRAVMASGRGDQFEDIDLDLSGYNLVVVMPDIHISTIHAYSGITPRKPDVSLKTLLKSPVAAWRGQMVNDFEASVFPLNPAIADVKATLYGQGAIYAQMSGSGAAVFGIFAGDVALDLPGNYNVYYNTQ